MKKEFIITVEKLDNKLIVDRENKGFYSFELIGLLQTEITRLINDYNLNSNIVNDKK